MLPFIGRLPVNSQILAITFLSKFGVENSICPTTCKHFHRVPFGTKVRDFLEPGRSVENVQSMVWNKVSGRAECEMGLGRFKSLFPLQCSRIADDAPYEAIVLRMCVIPQALCEPVVEMMFVR